jgi:hypothetical protein
VIWEGPIPSRLVKKLDLPVVLLKDLMFHTVGLLLFFQQIPYQQEAPVVLRSGLVSMGF